MKSRVDESTGESVFYFDGLAVIDPRLSAITGDAVHNLRSALDHLADALVRECGGTPTENTTFPILLTPPTANRRGETRPQIPPGVSMPIRVQLDAVQPYLRDKPEIHQLHLLHRLDITDKHRQLLLAVFRASSTSWSGERMRVTHFSQGPYTDGDEIARFAATDNGPCDPDFRPAFTLFIAIDDPEAGPHETSLDVVEYLRKLPLYYIEGRVLPRFEPFFD